MRRGIPNPSKRRRRTRKPLSPRWVHVAYYGNDLDLILNIRGKRYKWRKIFPPFFDKLWFGITYGDQGAWLERLEKLHGEGELLPDIEPRRHGTLEEGKAFLMSAGWSRDRVDRFLAGGSGSSGYSGHSGHSGHSEHSGGSKLNPASPLFERYFQQGASWLKFDEDLTNKAKMYAAEYWPGRIPNIDIIKVFWNERLTSTGGRAVGTTRMQIGEKRGEHIPRIELNVRYHGKYPDEVDSTIKHELIHFIPEFAHGHPRGFEYELGKSGASRFLKYHMGRQHHVYICPECKREHTEERKLGRIERLRCPECSISIGKDVWLVYAGRSE